MRILDGDQFLVRIFLGESDRFHQTPLARALLDRLRAEGFDGATVNHGIAGFGASEMTRTVSPPRLSVSSVGSHSSSASRPVRVAVTVSR